MVVTKHNGELRMCIDYTNLNKVILKKPFFLPCIDQVVDAMVGHEVLYFLDEYKGYHQFPMSLEDMRKTTFVTNDCIFYITHGCLLA